MKTVFNIKKLLVATAAIASVLGAKAAAPEGYTDLGGTYSFQVNDVHANSGKWYINGEFQPVDGATIDGADWYVENIVAIQGNGKILNLKSGSLVITGTNHDTCWPNNYDKWINFVPFSTLSVTLSLTRDQILAEGVRKNYRYNNKVLTSDAFEAQFTFVDNGNGTTTFTPNAPSAAAAYLGAVALMSDTSDDRVKVTVPVLQEGQPAATVYAAWDLTDKGTELSAWGDNVFELGSAVTGETLVGYMSGLPERTTVQIRVFAVSGGAVADYSLPMALYTRAYGVEGVINEWIAEEGAYTAASNWSLGHTPADSEIRWFESGVCNFSGNFVARTTDVFKGGRIVATAEFQTSAAQPNVVVDGTYFNCTILSLRSSFELRAGGFETTLYNNNLGIWRDGNSIHCNLTADSTATITFPITRAEMKTRMTGSDHFLYMGEQITAADFEDPTKWSVVEVSDNVTRFSRAISVEGAPEFGAITATVDSEENTQVTIAAELAKNGASPVTRLTVKYGLSLSDLTQQADFVFSQLADGDTAQTVISGLSPKRRYTFVVEAENGELTSESNPGTFISYIPAENHAVWIGSKSSSASDGENWLPKGAVIGSATDVEVIDALAVNKVLDWNLSSGVKSWTQERVDGSGVRVDFETTLEDPLVITGDVRLDNTSNWRVKTPSASGQTPVFSLNVEVGGDMTIAEGATVQAGRELNSDNSRAAGYYNAGPGFVDIGPAGANGRYKTEGRGASYGGDGGYRAEIFNTVPEFVSYGAILNPLTWGSSGHGDNAAFAGGGLVRLVVGGRLVVNGTVESCGFGYPNFNAGTSVGASSGGTINIVAGQFSGSGSILANGGCDETGGNGAGGRIRVKLTGASSTFDGFDIAKITAMGGYRRDGEKAPNAGIVDAAAGTIALQTAADNEKSGTVILRNQIRKLGGENVPVGATHFPSMQNGDAKLSGIKLVVAADTFVKLTTDATISRLSFEGKAVKSGVYTAAQLNETVGKDRFSGDGVLTVGGTGFALIIR